MHMKGTDRKNCTGGELPVGLSRALAQNTRAMAYFSGLSAEERQSVIAGTHGLRSAREMQEYVDRISGPE